MYIYSVPKGANIIEADSREEIYWRKSNAIHRWFVENVQNNVDDCDYYLLTKENFESLYKLCKKALATKEEGLLKPLEGFFFGSTSYDDYYWESIEYTKKEINKILLFMNEKLDYYYHSSS